MLNEEIDDELEEGELKSDEEIENEEDNNGDEIKQETIPDDVKQEETEIANVSNNVEDTIVDQQSCSPRHSSGSSHREPSRSPSPRQRKSSLTSRYGRRRGEDQSDKEAMLISMRTKLIEARSRELEMKMMKKCPSALKDRPSVNKHIPQASTTEISKTSSISRSPSTPRMLKPSLSPRSHKSPISIRPSTSPSLDDHIYDIDGEKIDWPKDIIKRTTTRPSITFSINPHACEERIFTGPKTPPENEVTDFDETKIVWPSQLVQTTISTPPISFSINPKHHTEKLKTKKRGIKSKHKKKKRKHKSSSKKHKRKSKKSSSKTNGVVSHGSNESDTRDSIMKATNYQDIDLDFTWYYNYFRHSFDMNHHQALYQAYYSVITCSDNDSKNFDRWLKLKKCSKEKLSEVDTLAHVRKIFNDSEFIMKGNLTENHTSEINSPNRIDTIVTRLKRHQSEHADHKVKIELIDTSKRRKSSPQINENQTNENLPDSKVNDTPKIKSEKSDTIQKITRYRPLMPQVTVIKSHEEIILPNGQLLPPGTIQTIVHPYPRIDSEVLGPHYDFF